MASKVTPYRALINRWKPSLFLWHWNYNAYRRLYTNNCFKKIDPSTRLKVPDVIWLIRFNQQQKRSLGYVTNCDPDTRRSRNVPVAHNISILPNRIVQPQQSHGDVVKEEYMQEFVQKLLDPNGPYYATIELENAGFWDQTSQALQWLLEYSQPNQRIRHCIQIYDHLATMMPRDAGNTSSLVYGPIFWGILETDLLLNRILVQWKSQYLSEQKRRRRTSSLPSPSEMAQKVEHYRWKCLFRPNVVTFNILLHAMVVDEGVPIADRYLERLLQVAASYQIPPNELESEAELIMVDTVSVSTVLQGWAKAGHPDKAQAWLDRMIEAAKNPSPRGSVIDIRPNTVTYTFAIQGWAKLGQANKAEKLLEKCLDAYRKSGDQQQQLQPDRVLFHAVLEAWSNVTRSEERNKIAPQRAIQLIQRMEDVAKEMEQEEKHNSFENVRPNILTWCMLVAIYARSNSKQYGLKGAEDLLFAKEQEMGETAPIIVVNRILHEYCNCGRVKEALRFLQNRFETGWESTPQSSRTKCSPDVVTMNTILAGFAKISSTDPDAPLHADEWLKLFSEKYGIEPSIQTYSSILNAWSRCVRLRDDAAKRAEETLRNQVVDLYYEKSDSLAHHSRRIPYSRGTFNNQIDELTVCVNIVLKGWAISASHHYEITRNRYQSQYAVEKSVTLLYDFLQDPDARKVRYRNSPNDGLNGVKARPTDVTFRTVFHTILDSGIPQMYDRANVILQLMQQYGFQPTEHDLNRLTILPKEGTGDEGLR
jgi:hypothetical protein